CPETSRRDPALGPAAHRLLGGTAKFSTVRLPSQLVSASASASVWASASKKNRGLTTIDPDSDSDPDTD
ncbi:MAG: hypothetical protein PVG19_12870, partial [Desulfobacterales bacterium]